MSDLSRILHLSGMTTSLRESTSVDPAINAEIEAALSKFPTADQPFVVDALDALKAAGTEGLSPKDWMAKVNALHPDTDAATNLKAVIRAFPGCVVRSGDRRYAWIEKSADVRANEIDPSDAAAIKGQIGLTYAALSFMRGQDTFSKGDVAGWLAQRGLTGPQGAQYTDHLLTQFGAELVGTDRYRLPPDAPHTNDDSMALLKSLATNPRNPDV